MTPFLQCSFPGLMRQHQTCSYLTAEFATKDINAEFIFLSLLIFSTAKRLLPILLKLFPRWVAPILSRNLSFISRKHHCANVARSQNKEQSNDPGGLLSVTRQLVELPLSNLIQKSPGYLSRVNLTWYFLLCSINQVYFSQSIISYMENNRILLSTHFSGDSFIQQIFIECVYMSDISVNKTKTSALIALVF